MATLFETAMNSFNAGTDMINKGKARKAAVEQYGDMARDPGLFSALQGIELAERRDVRAQQQVDFNQDLQSQKWEHEQGAYDYEKEGVDIKRREDGILNLVQGLRQARDNGQDLGEAFDGLAETLPNLGVDAADIPKLREELLANPAILDTYYESLAPPSKSTTGTKGLTAKQAADAKKADVTRVAAAQGLLSRLNQLEGTNLPTDERKELMRTQASVLGMPVNPAKWLQGGFGKYGTIPGTSAGDYAADIEALEADVRAFAFETLKGGGQITEAESKFAADAIAQLSRARSPESFQEEMRRLRRYMERLADPDTDHAKILGELKSGVDPYDDSENYPSKTGATNEIYPGYVDAELGTFKGGDPGDPANWEKTGE